LPLMTGLCMQVLIAARPPGRYGAAQECCRRHRADCMQVLIAALSPFTFTGTALLKNAVGYTELTLYAPEIAAAKAAAAALAAGERPLPIGVGKTSSSWKKVPSASRPGAFSYLHEPSGYKQAEFPENDWLPDDAPAQFHKKMKNKK
jgi:hypothetical protein